MASDAAWSRQWRPSTAELLDIVVIRPGIAGRVAGTEQRVICQALDWRRRFVRRWIVSERGRRRVAWPRRGPA